MHDSPAPHPLSLRHAHSNNPRFGKAGMGLAFSCWKGRLSLSQEGARRELCWQREVCLTPSAAWSTDGGEAVCQQSRGKALLQEPGDLTSVSGSTNTAKLHGSDMTR